MKLLVEVIVLLGPCSCIQAAETFNPRRGPAHFAHQRARPSPIIHHVSQTENPLEAIYSPRSTSNLDHYHIEHRKSVEDPNSYWYDKAYEFLHWDQEFKTVLDGSLENGDVTWFAGGKLNVAYNAIDRHVKNGKADQVALLWEGDEPDQIRSITYRELQQRVSQIANALKARGVQKGDVVTIYMPMIPELAMTMLACARIGAVHSVVFAGFSAEALAQRISAAQSKTIVTADLGRRGGKTISLKEIVEKARLRENSDAVIKQILVWEHGKLLPKVEKTATSKADKHDEADSLSGPSFELGDKDVYMNALVDSQSPYCPPVTMDSEDNLFILYTSGSTGQPKGLVHTTGGYALYAAFTAKTTFDLSEGDLFACVADCGWITGHTYVVYGPLLNGGTTFLFESTPVYPNPGRYWDMIERHKITQFYTAPTAIRLLMGQGDEYPKKYDLSSLKILGTVGEPINPEAWRWYYQVIGGERCTVVDTYWQTETGGHAITNLPGVTPMKPGSCTLPMFGIDAVVLNPLNGQELEPTMGPDGKQTPVSGVLAIRQPWPGMARTCLGDHGRFMAVYLKPYPGYYFTGDGVLRDEDGYHYITGRVDDVLNVAGHRIGTAEIESALVLHPAVAQAAVVGKPHDIKGQAIVAFVMLKVNYLNKESVEEEQRLIQELRNQVRTEIGPIATPDDIIIAPSLPMTRSGKIMRRILRKIVAGELDSLGDTTTLADPSIVGTLIDKVEKKK